MRGIVNLERKPIVVVGSINTDLVANTDHIPLGGETVTGDLFQVFPGGKGANQAVAVARLGYPVHLIGRLGDDAFGEQMRSHLTSAGVDISRVATSSGSSGVAVIVVARNGENSIVVVPGANADVSCEDIDRNIEIIRAAGIVLTQLELPLETVLYLAEVCEREGIPLMLDPAPARSLPLELLRKLAWITPNETEAAILIGASLDEAEDLDPQMITDQLLTGGSHGVVLKRSSRGGYLSSEGVAVPFASFAVNPVDTTAAGDCFNGAFATGLMMKMTPIQSARFASAAAAISVTRRGAQPSMPSLEEVHQMMEANPMQGASYENGVKK